MSESEIHVGDEVWVRLTVVGRFAGGYFVSTEPENLKHLVVDADEVRRVDGEAD